jgi:DNA-binding XRE family transcriptional regulator
MAAAKGNNYAAGNKGGGTKSLYQQKFAKMAERACQAGFTDIELADLLGVSSRTINSWKVEHEEFASALKAGKSPADERVERSLFARATGYSYDAVKIFNHQGVIVEAPYREHVPPDTTACIFWLKNRKSAEWRDKQEVEHSGGVTMTVSPIDERI